VLITPENPIAGLLTGAVATLDIPPELRIAATVEYEKVGNWLADHADHNGEGWKIYPQGSFLLGTVVRPQGRDEYDLDLVCERSLTKQQTTQTVLKSEVGDALRRYVQARLGEDGGSLDIDERKRCWTLVYGLAFHLDVLPAIPCPDGSPTGILLTDKRFREWQSSDPIAYGQWFRSRMEREIVAKRMVLAEARRVEPTAIPEAEIKTTPQLVVQLLKLRPPVNTTAALWRGSACIKGHGRRERLAGALHASPAAVRVDSDERLVVKAFVFDDSRSMHGRTRDAHRPVRFIIRGVQTETAPEPSVARGDYGKRWTLFRGTLYGTPRRLESLRSRCHHLSDAAYPRSDTACDGAGEDFLRKDDPSRAHPTCRAVRWRRFLRRSLLPLAFAALAAVALAEMLFLTDGFAFLTSGLNVPQLTFALALALACVATAGTATLPAYAPHRPRVNRLASSADAASTVAAQWHHMLSLQERCKEQAIRAQEAESALVARNIRLQRERTLAYLDSRPRGPGLLWSVLLAGAATSRADLRCVRRRQRPPALAALLTASSRQQRKRK